MWVQGFVLREDELLTMTQLAVVFSTTKLRYSQRERLHASLDTFHTGHTETAHVCRQNALRTISKFHSSSKYIRIDALAKRVDVLFAPTGNFSSSQTVNSQNSTQTFHSPLLHGGNAFLWRPSFAWAGPGEEKREDQDHHLGARQAADKGEGFRRRPHPSSCLNKGPSAISHARNVQPVQVGRLA